jgi:hypothetical protein
MLSNVLDLTEDNIDLFDSLDRESGEELDEEIIESGRNRLFQSVLDEFEYRERILGTSYPFKIDWKKTTVSTDMESAVDNTGKLVYLCCLLGSCLRRHRFERSQSVALAKRQLPNVFQVCACLAAGGFTLGEVVSFGFPRPESSGFLSALGSAYQRFKIGSVIHAVPPGVTSDTKDGGIDIIAWLDHPDTMPSKFYVLGQCASGTDWKNKSVVESARSFHTIWFSRLPAWHFTPAMFIPFFSHDELDEQLDTAFLEQIKGFLWSQELTLGIIFDRGRMSCFAERCMEHGDMLGGAVDGLDRLDTVRAWVLGQITEVKGQL